MKGNRDSFFQSERPEIHMRYRHSINALYGISIQVQLNCVMSNQLFFSSGKIGLVIDDNQLIVLFQQAVNNPLKENVFLWFAGLIKQLRRKENGEWQFFSNKRGSGHFSQRAMKKGKDILNRGMESGTGKDGFFFVIGEDITFMQRVNFLTEKVRRRIVRLKSSIA